MLAIQSPPTAWFPSLSTIYSHPSSYTMTTSPPSGGSTSVFHALGSYADRIKDKSLTPNGGSSTAGSSISPSPSAPQAKSPANPPARIAEEEEGAWETVQSGRQKARHVPRERERSDREVREAREPRDERDGERSRGSSSKDWRERPNEERRPAKAGTNALAGEKKKAGTGTPPSGTPHPPPPKSSSAAPKNAWGLITPATSSHTSPPASVSSTTIQTPRSNGPSNTVQTPSSPSVAEAPSAASMTSPNLSSDIASASTPPTSIAKDEDDWRTPSKTSSAADEIPPPPVPAPAPPQVAAQPLVNAWEARKKAVVGSGVAATPERPARLQFGTVTPRESPTSLPEAEEGVKIVKKQGRAAPVDLNAFPDLAKAAEITQAEKKEDKKDKKESEESSVVEEAAGPGKKTKWTAIPASELLAAADEAAEAQRRASRDTTGRKKANPAKRGESSQPSTKGASRRGSFDAKRGRGRSGSSSEIRLPPLPSSSKTASTFKPVFGSVRAGSTGSGEEESRDATTSHGGFSAPLSRTTSRRSDTNRSKTQVPSPAAPPLALDGVARLNGPFTSIAETSSKLPSHTAPLPQVPFAQSANPTNPNPRIQRRDARGSFSGRGKFRGGKPGFGGGNWNADGTAEGQYANTNGGQPNLYQRGYGMGYQNFGYGYDPLAAQGQYGGLGMYQPRGSAGGQMAPAPMPMTIVPNLDALRFYVLGQVEYYFSMQNLAMDFFLRQQMDSEGWIDIAMIASFNRIRSLTPEVTIVKEVMLLSSLLEVRDEKVRLARGESKKWVLPDAKPSPYTPDHSSPLQPLSQAPSEDSVAIVTNGVPSGLGMGEVGGMYNPYATEGYQYPEGFEQGIWSMTPEGPDSGYGLGMGMSPAMQYSTSTPRFIPGEVENALMKNGGGGGGSTSGTTATGTETREGTEGGGDETAADTDVDGKVGEKWKGGGDTPATSIEGDEERVKVELS